MYIKTSTGYYLANCNYSVEERLGDYPQLNATISYVDNKWISSIRELDRVFINGDQNEFVILKASKKTVGNSYNVSIIGVGAFYFDFVKSRKYDVLKSKTWTIVDMLDFVFSGSGYTYELSGNFPHLEFQNFGNKDRLNLFNNILNRFEAEYKVVGKTIFISNKIGIDTGFQFRYLKNIKDTNYEIDATNLCTYVKGLGGELPDGQRLEVEYESELVSEFGRLHHDVVVDERMTIPESLLEKCKKTLDETLSISLKTTLLDLQSQNYNSFARIGDYIWFIDERINIEQKMRFNSVKTYYSFRDDIIKQEVTLGDKDVIARFEEKHIEEQSSLVEKIDDLKERQINTERNLEAERANWQNTVNETVEEKTKAIKEEIKNIKNDAVSDAVKEASKIAKELSISQEKFDEWKNNLGALTQADIRVDNDTGVISIGTLDLTAQNVATLLTLDKGVMSLLANKLYIGAPSENLAKLTPGYNLINNTNIDTEGYYSQERRDDNIFYISNIEPNPLKDNDVIRLTANIKSNKNISGQVIVNFYDKDKNKLSELAIENISLNKGINKSDITINIGELPLIAKYYSIGIQTQEPIMIANAEARIKVSTEMFVDGSILTSLLKAGTGDFSKLIAKFFESEVTTTKIADIESANIENLTVNNKSWVKQLVSNKVLTDLLEALKVKANNIIVPGTDDPIFEVDSVGNLYIKSKYLKLDDNRFEVALGNKINEKLLENREELKGVSVRDVSTEFYLSTSGESLVNGSWSGINTENNSKYKWQRTKTVFTDNTVKYTTPTVVSIPQERTFIAYANANDSINILGDKVLKDYLPNNGKFTNEWVEINYNSDQKFEYCAKWSVPNWPELEANNLYTQSMLVRTDGEVDFSELEGSFYTYQPTKHRKSKAYYELLEQEDGYKTYRLWHTDRLEITHKARIPDFLGIKITGGSKVQIGGIKLIEGDVFKDFSFKNSNKSYIGVLVTSEYTVAPTDVNLYKWTKLKGEDGAQGIQGPKGDQGVPGLKGQDGRTPYFHTAYANSSDGSRDFSTTISEGKKYIGTCTDYYPQDPTNPSSYIWVKFKGDDFNPELLKIGGRNYAEDTGFNKGFWIFSKGDNSSVNFTTVDGIYTVTGNTNTWKQLQIYSKEDYYMDKQLASSALKEIVSGETYTLSFEAKVNSGNPTIWASVRENVKKGNNIDNIRKDFTLTNDYKKYNVSGFLNHSGDNHAYWRIILGYNFIGSVSFRNVKLERGNISTDWTPAPEDYQGHQLSATLSWINRKYENKYLTSGNLELDVYYDNEKISTGYTVTLYESGAGFPSINDSPTTYSNSTLNKNFSNVKADGSPYTIKVKVNYKGLIAVDSITLYNNNDLDFELKEKRNYLVHTDFPRTFYAVKNNGFTVDSKQYHFYNFQSLRELGFKVGDKITFSCDFDIKQNENTQISVSSLRFELYSDRYLVPTHIVDSPRGDNNHFTHTITLVEAHLTIKYVALRVDNCNCVVVVRNARINKSDTEQKWQLADEDNNRINGARNYILDSGDMNLINRGSFNGMESRVINGILRIDSRNKTTHAYPITMGNLEKVKPVQDNFEDGEDFVISFTMRRISGMGQPAVYLKEGLGYYELIGNLTDKFSTMWFTGKYKREHNLNPHLGFYGDNSKGIFEIKNWSINKGTYPIDWIPAPEDDEVVIKNLKETTSNIQQTQNSITNTVQAHTQELTTQAQKILNTESKVTQLEDSWGITASKVESISRDFTPGENICAETNSVKTGNDLHFNSRESLKANNDYTVVFEAENIPNNQKYKVYGAKDTETIPLETGKNVVLVNYSSDQTKVNLYTMGNTTKIKNVKIYKGNWLKWFGDFYSKKEMDSKLRVAVEGITSTVSEKTTDMDNKITTLENTVSQTASGLSTKVSKGSIISEINQSAEEIKIRADKLKLDGRRIDIGDTGFFDTLSTAARFNVPYNNSGTGGVGMQIRGSESDGLNKGVSIYKTGDLARPNVPTHTPSETMLTVYGEIQGAFRASKTTPNSGNITSALGIAVMTNRDTNTPIKGTGRVYSRDRLERISWIGFRTGSANQFWLNTGTGVDADYGVNVGNLNSDRKLKTNIVDCEHSGLEIINQLKFHEFDWKPDKFGTVKPHTKIGLIAQEVREIQEDLVFHEPNALSIDDFRLLNIAVKAIQELSAENKILKEKINKLERVILNENSK